MTLIAIPIGWLSWYQDEIENLRNLVADVPHPAGAQVCHEWLTDMIQAAHEDRHEDAARLSARIRAKYQQEWDWIEEDREALRKMREERRNLGPLDPKLAEILRKNAKMDKSNRTDRRRARTRRRP
jgi:hypothetical protein